jgi:hypothetical protein
LRGRSNWTPGIHSITFDCTGDPYDLGLFWSELLGRPLADDDKPGDPEALLQDPDGGPRLLFVRVPEGKTAKNRIHFDLKPKGRTREEEVDRAIASPRRPGDRDHPPRRRRLGHHGGPRGERILRGAGGVGLSPTLLGLGVPRFPIASERVCLHSPRAERHGVSEDVRVLVPVRGSTIMKCVIPRT